MTEHVLEDDSDIETPTNHSGEYASYEDDGALVVCDRSNPKAWIRSDTTAEPRR